MARKRPFFEFILQVINLVFTVFGLSALGYGLVSLFNWRQSIRENINIKQMIVRRLLFAIDVSQNSYEFSKNWFVYLMIAIGAFLLIVSFFGYVGAATRSPCCLLTYCMLLVSFIIVELTTALFIHFDHIWKKVIPEDTNGYYNTIYNFLNDHWKIMRWIALGVFIIQVIAFILAIYLRSVFNTRYEKNELQRVVYRPRRKQTVAPKRTTSPPTTPSGNNVNARDPTNPTNPSNTANVNARVPTNFTKK